MAEEAPSNIDPLGGLPRRSTRRETGEIARF